MKKKIVNTIFDFFKSIKLAIILLVYIAITSILATLVPQGNDVVFYQKHYHPFLSWLILSSGLYDFFRSFLFLVPVFLFSINLIVCMLSRFIREIVNKQKKRFGPDIIHFGILLLIIGSLITFFLKRETFFYMAEGEQVILVKKYVLTLISFKEIRYPDGRPKEWISLVNVQEIDEDSFSSFPIEVNNPLELEECSVYQNWYYDQQFIVLEDTTGREIQLPEGHPLPGSDNNLFFVRSEKDEYGQDNNTVIIEQRENNNVVKKYEYTIGSYIGDYVIKDKTIHTLSRLQVVSDPGFLPIIISFIIITAGLSLTFIQKIGDKKL